MNSNHPKITVVVGTRAQLIKTAPVMKELQIRGIDYRFVFTAQHRETIEDIQKNFMDHKAHHTAQGRDKMQQTMNMMARAQGGMPNLPGAPGKEAAGGLGGEEGL